MDVVGWLVVVDGSALVVDEPGGAGESLAGFLIAATITPPKNLAS